MDQNASLWRFGAARLAGAAAPRLIALRLRGCAALYYASGSLNVTFVLINPVFISLEHHVKMMHRECYLH